MSDQEHNPPLDHQRLAEEMRARVDELGLKWTALARYSGTSTQTIRNLRDGKHLPHSDTRHAIEDGLGWRRGSIMLVLRGGDPLPLPPDEAGRAPLTLPAPPPPATHGLGSDLERLGLDPDDPDVQGILVLKHISRRSKIRWLAELADAIAAEHETPPTKRDQSPKRGSL